MDCTLPGSSFHGTSQARVLEWFAISFSRGSFRRYRFDPLLTQGSNLHLLHWQVDSLLLKHKGIPYFDTNVKQTVCLFWKFPKPEFLSCNSIHCITRCHLAVFASNSGNKGLTNWWEKKKTKQVNILYTAIVVSSTLSLTQKHHVSASTKSWQTTQGE